MRNFLLADKSRNKNRLVFAFELLLVILIAASIGAILFIAW